jgi:hypothetical protein
MRREPLLWACSVWIQYHCHTVLAYSLNSFLVLFCAVAIIKLVPLCKKLQPFPHSNQLGIVCFLSHNLMCLIFVHDFSKPSLINPCEFVSGHSIHHGDTVRDEGFLACTLCQKFHFPILLTITDYTIISLSHLPESIPAWMFCQKFHFAILLTIT